MGSQVSEFKDDLFPTFSIAMMQRNVLEENSLHAPFSLLFYVSKMCCNNRFNEQNNGSTRAL